MSSSVSSFKALEVSRLSSSFSLSEVKNEMKGDALQEFRQMSLDNLSSSLAADKKAKDKKYQTISTHIINLYKSPAPVVVADPPPLSSG